MKNRLLTFICLVFISFSSIAQTPQLVYDIFPGGASHLGPSFLTAFNNRLYFAAHDGIHGQELWSYDGTNIPTMVADICPGQQSGFPGQTDEHMAVLNGKLYFPANDGTTGVELYSFDGINPPILAADIITGTGNSTPHSLITVGSKLYFIASSINGNKLYSYNGINVPVLADTIPGMSISSPTNLTPFMGKIYFMARDSIAGFELFSYDTATNFISLVQDIYTGSGHSFPQFLKVIGSKLYFLAGTSVYGNQLYSFDGINAIRLTSRAGGMKYCRFDTARGALFFSGDTTGITNMLCKYDFITGNTSSVKESSLWWTVSGLSDIITFNNNIYFTASRMSFGNEIWISDGDTAMILADLNPGYPSSYASDFYIWDNSLYLVAHNGTAGYELFRISEFPSAGIQSVAFDGEATVFPNPFNGNSNIELTLKAPQDMIVTLHDAIGRNIYSVGSAHYIAGKSIIVLPTGNLPAGHYLYCLRSATGGLLKSGKMIKQ